MNLIEKACEAQLDGAVGLTSYSFFIDGGGIPCIRISVGIRPSYNLRLPNMSEADRHRYERKVERILKEKNLSDL